MSIRLTLLTAGVVAALGSAVGAAEAEGTLRLSAEARELLWQEPILVQVQLEGTSASGLPAAPGEGTAGNLRFEIVPAVPARPGAKPLPQEAREASGKVRARHYDLLEWFQFPENGSWTVTAILEADGSRLASAPLKVSVRKPAAGDPELPATSRLHHMPWSNYESNAFCGDTFDVVKTWPESRLARYCHYWNGRYLQNRKEYTKAIASYRTAAGYSGFVLAKDAERAIAECEQALAKEPAAGKTDGKPSKGQGT